MEKDPNELRDRSEDPGYQRVKQELIALLLQQQKELNDTLGQIGFSVYQTSGNLVSHDN